MANDPDTLDARGLDLVAPLVALARAGIPTDVQDLLVQGDPMRGIAPGALAKALAAVSTAPVAGVRVKPLEWDRDSKPGIHLADTLIGTYAAFADGTLKLDDVQLSYIRGREWHDTEAAAQADHDRRVLSALTTAPVGDAKPVAWQRRLLPGPKVTNTDWHNITKEQYDFARETGGIYGVPEVRCEVRPLYTTPIPTPPADAVREALIDALAAMESTDHRHRSNLEERAIRQARSALASEGAAGETRTAVDVADATPAQRARAAYHHDTVEEIMREDAVLTAPPQGWRMPDGWKLVPVAMTRIQAAEVSRWMQETFGFNIDANQATALYANVLAVTPLPTGQEG